MMEFLSFRKMITPLFIQVLFWIGTAVIVVAGVITLIGGGSSSSAPQMTPFGPIPQPPSSGNGGNVLYGLLIIVLGPIMWRVYCELLIVIFKIHSELVAIRNSESTAGSGFPVATR